MSVRELARKQRIVSTRPVGSTGVELLASEKSKAPSVL